jgi:hypothetical protein
MGARPDRAGRRRVRVRRLDHFGVDGNLLEIVGYRERPA